MTPRQLDRWRRAGSLARATMGTRRFGREIVFCADMDPLAWWCLTEAIMDIGKPGRLR